MSQIDTYQDFRTVKYFRAPQDDRIIAIFVGADFDEFEKFPPYLDTEEERAHMSVGYQNADPDRERRTKAHLTDDSWPLQVIVLERDPGGTTLPHYHIPDQPLPDHPTRHQMMICQRGSAKIGLYTKQGDHLDDVILHANDMVIMLEGHRIEFLEPQTRLVEIKQGPFPGNDEADKIELTEVRDAKGMTV